jgi:hypothetical protein
MLAGLYFLSPADIQAQTNHLDSGFFVVPDGPICIALSCHNLA